MEYIIISILVIIILVGAGCALYPKILKLCKRKPKKVKEETVIQKPRTFNGKSKCFSCERQINKENDSQYNLVHPTKCFSCERQIDKTYNSRRSNLGHSTKCFDCEV